ncbi:hypothetical protein GCM10027403_13540 [Arthrobacter tecti]
MQKLKGLIKRSLAVGALTATVAAGGAIASVPAYAADRDGKCNDGEFCYFYNSDHKGSVSDFTKSVGDYGTSQPECFEFRGDGKGKGECIKNEAASAWNRTGKDVTVYFNSNYGGATQVFKPGQKVNLKGSLYNGNASHRIGNAPQPSGDWASPAPANRTVTAGWYYPSGSFHGAIDVGGAAFTIKSACTGKVDKIDIDAKYPNSNAYKVSGSTNYVWVDCGGGIRMGYAHFYERDLPDSIKVGTKLKAGQNIVAMGNQGNSSGPHMHFEVRKNGEKIKPFDFLRTKGVTGLPN